MRQKDIQKWDGRIIWSADGLDWPSLQEVLQRDDFPREEVAVKLDRLFLTKYGLDKISAVQEMGIPVFADAKIVEIPSKTMELVKLHLEQRPWMLNVMAQICNTGVATGVAKSVTDKGDSLDVLNEFAEECKKAGTRPCVVTVLTSKTADLVKWEYDVRPNDAVWGYANLAVNCGVTDIVCSPLEAKYIRSYTTNWPEGICLNTPGVRLAGSAKNDQARVMTPGEALANGADRLVIGRDLSRNGDFAGNFAKIKADIQEWQGKA